MNAIRKAIIVGATVVAGSAATTIPVLAEPASAGMNPVSGDLLVGLPPGQNMQHRVELDLGDHRFDELFSQQFGDGLRGQAGFDVQMVRPQVVLQSNPDIMVDNVVRLNDALKAILSAGQKAITLEDVQRLSTEFTSDLSADVILNDQIVSIPIKRNPYDLLSSLSPEVIDRLFEVPEYDPQIDLQTYGPDEWYFQVTPGTGVGGGVGTPKSGGGFTSTPAILSAGLAGTLVANGQSTIDYLEDAYPEVTRITLSVPIEDGPEPNNDGSAPADDGTDFAYFGTCSGVLVSEEWVLTAMHCFARNEKEFDLRLSKNLDDLNSVAYARDWIVRGVKHYKAAVTAADIGLVGQVDKVALPYRTRAEVSFTNSHGYSGPRIDLALAHIVRKTGTRMDFSLYDAIKGMALASLGTGNTLQKGDPISFSGFGWTNVSTSKDFEKLTAFNLVNSVDSEFLTWRSESDGQWGGPCPRDSGGPVYAGFNRGYAGDARDIVALVSHFPNPVASVAACFGQTGYAVLLKPYIDDIRAISGAESLEVATTWSTAGTN